ncbi:MAG: FtsX-like permease family protein [Acidobacteria bacterium]|nr:FtsX-like permease family protein [Acidobacteriota bacterium]
MSGAPRPPRVARALLHKVLPAIDRAGAMAELDDKYAEVVRAGLPRPRLWYWRQVLGAIRPSVQLRSDGERAGGGWMSDIRFGIRMLMKSPATSFVILITLAIGLGFNGAVFSLVNTIALMELPFEESDRIRFVDAWHQTGEWDLWLTYADYAEIESTALTIDSAAAWYRSNVTVRRGGALPERVLSTYVSPTIFDVLAFQPTLGRRLTVEDGLPGAEPVALIGHAAWQTQHGGDNTIVGQTIHVQGIERTIVGVLPEDLERTPFAPSLWMPIPDVGERANNWEARYCNVIVRAGADNNGEQVAAELIQLGDRLAVEHPETHENLRSRVRTYREVYVDDSNRLISLIMMGAVVFLLLIACANVANLLISRILHRGREVAIRAALGASRWRVIRQLLIESLLLSFFGAVGGVLAALGGAKLLAAGVTESGAPPWFDFRVGFEVYAVVVGLAFASGILFGFMPALHAARASIGDVLKESGRGTAGSVRTRRITGALVVLQIAFAVILLAGAGVMTRSALNVQRVDWGMDTNVLTMRLSLDEERYPESEERIAFHAELDRKAQAIPGIEAVGLTSSFPSQGGYSVGAEIESLPIAEGNPPLTFTQVIVAPNYFDLADLKPLRGRLLTDADGDGGDVPVLVEPRLAQRYWPDEDPLGQRFRLVDDTEERWMRVVGVVPQVLQLLPMSFLPDHPVFYSPYRAQPLRGMGLMVRGDSDREAMTTALRQAVREIDAELPLYSIDPLNGLIREVTFSWQVVAWLFSMLGGIALFLSCLGIYAVMAFAIGQREQEIGVRMALGARSRQVVGLVVRLASVQAVVGLVLGTLGAVFFTRLLATFLFDVSTSDPVAFAIAVGSLVLTAFLAAWLPARRASRVDPMRALQPD